MRVSGYGEFQQMRKLVQKEDALEKDKSGEGRAARAASAGDAVQISDAARSKARLRQASDYREARVRNVREKLESGTLVTPESLRGGTRKMLDALVAGEL
ncbi:MAG: flagellar biosynthesis anti-sigma factor FlgM [Planctomycetota bacterium]|jgi:anti-sigma28 factor (negative regulator of flagellin synthesis)|nr:flagellar biosynthesis anti-sigma factor FlgM [Planctomycetota bacterium]